MRIVSAVCSTSPKPSLVHAAASSPGPVNGAENCLARNASPPGSSAAAVSAKTRRKVSPPRKSQTQAATTPPGLVTRAISPAALSASGTKFSTNRDSAASNARSP